MLILVEYAPTIYVVIASGLLALAVIALFRLFGPRRKLSDDYRAVDDDTKFLELDGTVPPVRAALPAVYTGVARLNRGVARLGRKASDTVDAEILDSDEHTRKLVRP